MKAFFSIFFTALIASAAVTAFRVSRERSLRNEGWALKKVLSARVKLLEGEPLTREQVQVIEVPERFVSSNMIDASQLDAWLGKTVQHDVEAKDLVLQTHFLVDRLGSCAEAIEAEVFEAEEAVHEAWPPVIESGEVEPLPAHPLDAEHFATVVVASHHLKPGEVLGEGDLSTWRVPGSLAPKTIVDGSERAAILGAHVVVDIEKGDVLPWAFLARAGVSAQSECAFQLERAAEHARAEAARLAAERWAKENR